MMSTSRVFRAAAQTHVNLNSSVAFLNRGSLTLDRNDKLGDDGEDLGLTVLKKVEDSLDGEEAVWVLLLTDALHEDGQVVVVVKLFDLDFPSNFVGRAVLNLDGQVSTVVKASELRGSDFSLLLCSGFRRDGFGSFNGLIQG